MSDLLLGIDIGTSACKAAVFTLDGRVAAQCSEEYQVFYPKPGWAEQNPDDWWRAVCRCIQKIGRAYPVKGLSEALASTAKAGRRSPWTGMGGCFTTRLSGLIHGPRRFVGT